MNKDVKFTFYIALYIIVLFSGCIAWTFVTDYLQTSGFFGDVLLKEKNIYGTGIDPWWEWGTRHYLYFWMCLLLFVLSIARIILFVVTYDEK